MEMEAEGEGVLDYAGPRRGRTDDDYDADAEYGECSQTCRRGEIDRGVPFSGTAFAGMNRVGNRGGEVHPSHRIRLV